MSFDQAAGGWQVPLAQDRGRRNASVACAVVRPLEGLEWTGSMRGGFSGPRRRNNLSAQSQHFQLKVERNQRNCDHDRRFARRASPRCRRLACAGSRRSGPRSGTLSKNATNCNAANEKLHHIIADLRRPRFGRKSLPLSEDELALVLEELETDSAKTQAEDEKKDEDLKRERAKKRRANRGAFPRICNGSSKSSNRKAGFVPVAARPCMRSAKRDPNASTKSRQSFA